MGGIDWRDESLMASFLKASSRGEVRKESTLYRII